MRELVGDDRLELGGGRRAEQARAERERGAPGPAADDERAGKAVVDQGELRRRDPELRGERSIVERRSRILRERERPRAEHPEQGPVAEPVDGDRGEQCAEREQHALRSRTDQPAEPAASCERGSRRAGRP